MQTAEMQSKPIDPTEIETSESGPIEGGSQTTGKQGEGGALPRAQMARTRVGTFAKGTPGGPGRPKGLISKNAERRRVITRAMMSAVTLRRAQKAVKRMFEIIEGKDAKLSVMAFKALFDTLGLRQLPEDAGSRPSAYVFVLPGSGEIPGPAEIEPKLVQNLVGNGDPESPDQ